MTAVLQRPLRGSRISTFYPVKTLPSLSSLDSAFQLQEYISLLIRLNVHDVEAITSLPGKSNKEKEGEVNEMDEIKNDEKDDKGKTDVNVDEACWIYEQLRRLAQDLTHPLITMLQSECSRSTCPEMKAGEWLYLCVAHGEGGAMEQCCAIDYILHTLDSATALLNSPRAFPSRLQIPASSHRHFSSLARRLSRIFAHAYFHHREVFEQAEAESSLYARFLALTSKFDLVPAEFLVIPARMGSEDDNSAREGQRISSPPLDPEAESSRAAPPHPSHTPALWGQTLPGEFSLIHPKNRDPPGLSENQNSRKLGRTRTDTMVYSEAANMAEELAKFDDADAIPIPSDTTEEVEKSQNDDELFLEHQLVAKPQDEEEEIEESIPDEGQASLPSGQASDASAVDNERLAEAAEQAHASSTGSTEDSSSPSTDAVSRAQSSDVPDSARDQVVPTIQVVIEPAPSDPPAVEDETTTASLLEESGTIEDDDEGEEDEDEDEEEEEDGGGEEDEDEEKEEEEEEEKGALDTSERHDNDDVHDVGDTDNSKVVYSDSLRVDDQPSQAPISPVVDTAASIATDEMVAVEKDKGQTLSASASEDEPGPAPTAGATTSSQSESMETSGVRSSTSTAAKTEGDEAEAVSTDSDAPGTTSSP